MSPRPLFLDQPYFRQRTPRVDQSMADYASPVTRYQPSARAWIASDVVVALALVGVVAAVVFGVL